MRSACISFRNQSDKKRVNDNDQIKNNKKHYVDF